SMDDIVGSLRASLNRPQDSGYWLEKTRVDGGVIRVHPAEFYKTKDGSKARMLRSKPDDYHTLILAGNGLANKEIDGWKHVQDGVSRERLNRAQRDLGVKSDVALGRIAAELGLF